MTPIRPFPTRQLTAKLGLVQLRCNTLQEELMRAMTENAWEVVPWQQSMGYLMDVLDAICEAALDAREHCSERFDLAEREHEAAQRAAVALLRGLENARPHLRVIEGEKAA